MRLSRKQRPTASLHPKAAGVRREYSRRIVSRIDRYFDQVKMPRVQQPLHGGVLPADNRTLVGAAREDETCQRDFAVEIAREMNETSSLIDKRGRRQLGSQVNRNHFAGIR